MTDRMSVDEYNKYIAFPKPKRKKRTVSKKAKNPEEIIQGQTDELLKQAGIPYLRLPDTFFRAIFANQAIPVHVKKILKDELAGWPDNMAFIPVSDKFCLTCMIECKSDKGKLRGKQKARARQLPYNIIREFDELESLVKEFNFEAGKIIYGFENI